MGTAITDFGFVHCALDAYVTVEMSVRFEDKSLHQILPPIITYLDVQAHLKRWA